MQLTRTHFLINRLRRQLYAHLRVLRLFLGVLVIGVLILFALLLRHPLSQVSELIQQFTGSGLVEHSGRTNFLVMGISGGNHAGSDLTDTIIFVSANRNDKSLTLISLPRDIWVPSLRAKINTAYHYGYERSATSGGIILAKSAVSETIQQPVDYVVVLDFSTFSRAIDLIGGIDVNVDRTFDDYRYPITGKEMDPCDGDPSYSCRYEHLHFSAGLQHMDGTTALKYVRSRYSEDKIEGTDFGRARRQEKVVLAVVSKLLSTSSIRHPSVYTQLFKLLSESTISDIKTSQYFDLGAFLIGFRNTLPVTLGLTEPDQLTNPPISSQYDNQWVLIPAGNNPQTIYDFVAHALGTP